MSSEGVVTRQIGDCVSAVKTWNPAREAPNQVLQYIDIGSVSQSTKKITPNGEILGSNAPSRARQLVKSGDVLVSTVRPNLNAVACVDPDLDGATASTGFCVLRPEAGKLDSRYLFHWVRTPDFVAKMVRQATGQSYPAISDKIVKGSLIPLPPIEKQRRIATILDQADELSGLRQNSILKLNCLRQSLFHGVANKGTLPVELGEVCQFENGDRGKNYPGKKPLLSSGVPFVSAADLTADGNLSTSDLSFISEDRYHRLGSGRFSQGDFLFCLRGSLGKYCLVRDDIWGAIASSLVIIRPIDRVEAEFFFAYLASDHVRREIDRFSNGVAQPNLSLASLKKFVIQLPPRDVQERFVLRLQKIHLQYEHAVKALEKSQFLFASLQQRAFKGDL